MKRLDYSIVIATRNRPAALRLSIPRMLGQSRPPSQLIVVDSSDDHQATVRAVDSCRRDSDIDLEIIPAERGLTKQRNIGLKLVRNEIVFFPDDDSIWFPGTAAAILDVYARDTEGRIAAVCGAESSSPPPDWNEAQPAGYRMRTAHRLQQRLAALRARVENALFPDPARILGRRLWPEPTELPDWFAAEDVVLVEWMTGFRMSFRTRVITDVGFDETLSRYSLFEDVDASMGAWRHGWVVGARKARIFHYRSPERRDDGRCLGATQLLNKGYLISRHAPGFCPSRSALVGFGRYKAFQYFLGARDGFGRQRLGGARAALKLLPRLVEADRRSADRIYLEALATAMAAQPSVR